VRACVCVRVCVRVCVCERQRVCVCSLFFYFRLTSVAFLFCSRWFSYATSSPRALLLRAACLPRKKRAAQSKAVRVAHSLTQSARQVGREAGSLNRNTMPRSRFALTYVAVTLVHMRVVPLSDRPTHTHCFPVWSPLGTLD
jgi:hypothetical protein